MKIKIIADLPVASEVKPAIGSVHEVIYQQAGEYPLYFINPSSLNDSQRVGVAPSECDVVEA